jgi:RNA polymerase-binding protein DksA
VNEQTETQNRNTLLRQRLEEQLRAANVELAEIEERLQDKGDYGPGTGDPLVVRWELSLARHERVEGRIEALQEALKRLETGTYGLCESCGQPIDMERLEALPQATECIECARDQVEQE